MKIYTTMPDLLKMYFTTELDHYNVAVSARHLSVAWSHLERAHIIGQNYPFHHTFVHWKMLLFGIKIKNAKEIFGQIPRLLFGGVKSFVGKVPVGNPGGANVPPLKPFPIAKDLEEIFAAAGLR